MRYEMTQSGVCVQLHTNSPTDEEWSKLLEYLQKNREHIQRVIAINHGEGGPSSKQRGTLAQVLQSFPPRMPFVLLTDSRVSRGILTALNWVTGRAAYTAAFPTSEVDRALEFFELETRQRLEVQQVIAQLERAESAGAASG